MTLRVVADEGREPSPFLATAVALARGAAEQVAPLPTLFVVEFLFEGTWRPLCGDAYLDEAEAARCSAESSLETRVRRYVPGQEVK